ncbi:MAG TPA: hypothetical protein VHF51_18910 [Solirubrobacteraceae bacterium]|jgi:hypothetical protein|nr:hypothetical protein [Solirubrobacteraceae bacterium]
MSTIPAKPAAEVSAERVLFAMLGASLTLVGTIAGAALLPEAIGVTVALVVLFAALAAVGAFVRTLLRDPAPDAHSAAAA